MKVLHIDSSALGAASVSRELSKAITAQVVGGQPDVTVEYLDLDANPIPHQTGQVLAKADAADVARGEQLLAQFLASDVIVVGAPMYNFSVPSVLKAWLDRIAVAGTTFKYTETGPVGLAGGKTVIVASGRGGIHGDSGPTDFQEDYLKQFFGFLGITDVRFVRAEGVAYSEQHRADALKQAHEKISALTV